MSYRENDPYLVYAFYHFSQLEDLAQLVKKWQKELEEMDVRGRIYMHQQGVNAVCSLPKEHKELFESWVRKDARFADVFFKLHTWHEHTFARLNVRQRPYLVALDQEVDPSQGAEHISPQEWKEMLDQRDENTIVLDVRNQYEYELGHFEGAIAPNCKTFRDYIPVIEELAQKHDLEKTKVMMSCTGGIRCEIFSPLMKKVGFKNVYQLDGGVINYGLEVGNEHWKGKLFVFDDRMSIDICDKESAPIADCHFCQSKCEDVYNCANMDCNKMFFACPDCLSEQEGCCCKECQSAPRARPLKEQNPHRPFRRWYHYRQNKTRTQTTN